MKKKRILSIVLTLSLLTGLFPGTAMAVSIKDLTDSGEYISLGTDTESISREDMEETDPATGDTLKITVPIAGAAPNLVSSGSLNMPVISDVTGSNTGVTISWGLVKGAERYSVLRKDARNTIWERIALTAMTRYTDTTAENGMTYQYTVRCVSADGKTNMSSYDKAGKSITYTAAPVISSVTGSATGVTVKWGTVVGAEQYGILRKEAGETDWSRLDLTTGTSYTDTTAVSGTAYVYTVRCVSEDGKSYTGSYDETGKSITYTAAPANISATGSTTGVTVRWNRVAGAVKYVVLRKEAGATSWSKIALTASTSYIDKKAVSGMTYCYTVRCASDDGKSYTGGYNKKGISINYIADLGAPVISSVANAVDGVTVKWGKVAGAAQYGVFRKADGETSWSKLVLTSKTAYTDTTVLSGTTYYYTVRCIGEDGKSYTSSYDKKGKSVAYIAAPKISSIKNSKTGVTIKWSRSEGAAQYRVFRKADGATKWSKLEFTKETSYTDTTAVSGAVYTYTVRCVSADGKSYTSSYDATGKTITFSAAPKISSVTNTDKGVQIKWEAVENASKYYVYRKADGGSWEKIKKTTSLKYTDTTPVSGTKYYYAVKAVCNSAVSGYNYKAVTYVEAPVITTLKNYDSYVYVKWGKVTGAEKYRVYRKAAGDSKWTKLTDTTGVTYKDKAVKDRTKYTYTIRCINDAGSAYTSGYDATGKSITRPGDVVIGETGSIVSFGQYEQDGNLVNGAEPIEWRILAKENGKALLLSEKGLDAKPYNTDKKSITWEECTLRKWLNNDFYYSAFTGSEQTQIATTDMVNEDNPYYGSVGGKMTQDNVFLLSISDTDKYFKDDKGRMKIPTQYAINNGVKKSADYKKDGAGTCEWWLKSPGYDNNYAAVIADGGYAGVNGSAVNSGNIAVCPALWIKF